MDTPQTPSVGRIVHYFPGEYDKDACANGNGPNDPVAAVVVRVWSDTTLNLRLLLDSHGNPDDGGTPVRTSVQRDNAIEGATVGPGSRWAWPERV
jgi:hypothetical protein